MSNGPSISPEVSSSPVVEQNRITQPETVSAPTNEKKVTNGSGLATKIRGWLKGKGDAAKGISDVATGKFQREVEERKREIDSRTYDGPPVGGEMADNRTANTSLGNETINTNLSSTEVQTNNSVNEVPLGVRGQRSYEDVNNDDPETPHEAQRRTVLSRLRGGQTQTNTPSAVAVPSPDSGNAVGLRGADVIRRTSGDYQAEYRISDSATQQAVDRQIREKSVTDVSNTINPDGNSALSSGQVENPIDVTSSLAIPSPDSGNAVGLRGADVIRRTSGDYQAEYRMSDSATQQAVDRQIRQQSGGGDVSNTINPDGDSAFSSGPQATTETRALNPGNLDENTGGNLAPSDTWKDREGALAQDYNNKVGDVPKYDKSYVKEEDRRTNDSVEVVNEDTKILGQEAIDQLGDKLTLETDLDQLHADLVANNGWNESDKEKNMAFLRSGQDILRQQAPPLPEVVTTTDEIVSPPTTPLPATELAAPENQPTGSEINGLRDFVADMSKLGITIDQDSTIGEIEEKFYKLTGKPMDDGRIETTRNAIRAAQYGRNEDTGVPEQKVADEWKVDGKLQDWVNFMKNSGVTIDKNSTVDSIKAIYEQKGWNFNPDVASAVTRAINAAKAGAVESITPDTSVDVVKTATESEQSTSEDNTTTRATIEPVSQPVTSESNGQPLDPAIETDGDKEDDRQLPDNENLVQSSLPIDVPVATQQTNTSQPAANSGQTSETSSAPESSDGATLESTRAVPSAEANAEIPKTRESIEIPEDTIRERAYFISQDESKKTGSDKGDWFRALYELRMEKNARDLDQEDIEKRAYDIWEKRNTGSELGNFYQAANELYEEAYMKETAPQIVEDVIETIAGTPTATALETVLTDPSDENIEALQNASGVDLSKAKDIAQRTGLSLFMILALMVGGLAVATVALPLAVASKR
jgi:hypothetical protein